MTQNKTGNEITIKDASAKLDISEATVRKYIRDFKLQSEKATGNKSIISEETFQALSEIAKLRANGLSIQEIKELKSQQPTKDILDELEEGVKVEVEKDEDKKDEATPIEIAKDESIELVDDEKDLPNDKDNLEESDIEAEVDEEDVEEERIEEERIEEEGKPRRRVFNYRYVERQISNDSKRVSSLRQRLRNPNLSVQDRLFFEEALERRILFLDGWKHILRWVSLDK